LKITASTEDTDGDTEPEVFSSQAGENNESGLGFKPNSRYLEWPRLLDTVALCYLAALLMRLPVSVNDFYEYVYRFLFTSLKYALRLWEDFRLTYFLA
jgi:RNA polymerase I-specific transcription initiation factor RRN7